MQNNLPTINKISSYQIRISKYYGKTFTLHQQLQQLSSIKNKQKLNYHKSTNNYLPKSTR
jgi:hypothetical protein